ncbi:MAG: (E)-4-hydroxy-3-methylbut-2-enyl-diphosphate synthase [bacterium]
MNIGNLPVGANHPIPVQSMTNTDTMDTKSTVRQIISLVETGCEIVRITAPSVREAENLYDIKDELLKQGINIPLVADIHFTPKAAEVAAAYVEKVRLNPGNYVDRNRGKTNWSDIDIQEARKRITERLMPLLEICRAHNTAIRIGTNHGSLSERILSMYGNTPRGMMESAMEFVRICAENNFHNLVISMKASRVRDMISANLMLVEQMIREDLYYPLHLGVTEAGNGKEARIKSAAGIGNLLARGIGDTIRVSLAEDPLEEVPFGKLLVRSSGRNRQLIQDVLNQTELIRINSPKTLREITGNSYPVMTEEPVAGSELVQGKDHIHMPSRPGDKLPYRSFKPTDEISAESCELIYKRNYIDLQGDVVLAKASSEFSLLLYDKKSAGICISCDQAEPEEMKTMCLDILQGLGLRYHQAEFIACPTCGRTKFNLFESFEKVKEKTAHLNNLQIAVMGCIVNGPGEMGDADYGYVGAGPGKVTLYRHGEPAIKHVDEKRAVQELIDLIKANGDWTDP